MGASMLPSERSPVAFATLGLGLLAGLVARLAFAFHDDGVWWPDEYYQSLEPAHRAVFGYGWQAWEFLDGARHWTLPGFVAAIMKVSTLLHWDYLRAVEVTFCVAGTLTALATHRLARAQGASPLASAIAATVFSLMGLAVFAAPRAMGETLSALPVTAAFALLLQPPHRLRLVLAGILFSVAVALRLQNGLFCLGALGILFSGQRRADGAVLSGVLLVGAGVYGAVDAYTWGTPFHSAIQYLKFNVLEGRSSSFGTQPLYHYVRALVTAEGLTVLPLSLLAARSFRARPQMLIIILVFVGVHSVIPHKELRFLFPILPLLCAQGALGLDQFVGTRRAVLVVLMLLCALGSLLTLPGMTFSRLGISNPSSHLSAIDYAGPENRLLLRARDLPDLCGLQISSIENWRTGGYAYLHRPVPMYRQSPPETDSSHFNYVIARRDSVAGTEVAVEGDVALIRVNDSCTEDQAYDWHLE